jgi:ubiquinone/menaquinone biosynthesis C-methylase UbiE
MREIQELYHDLSQRYDEHRSNRYFRMIEEIEYQVLARHADLRPGTCVLEIGCGTGIFLARILPSGATVHGLDYTRGMLDVTRVKLAANETRLVNADARSLPYASDTFDVVYSFKVLPHVPNLPQALRDLQRVLRPGGVAVLEFYNSHSIRKLLYRGGYFHQWHSPAKARHLVIEAGLKVKRAYGARIFTLAAVFHDMPLLCELLRWGEMKAASTPLCALAGYYILVCENA